MAVTDAPRRTPGRRRRPGVRAALDEALRAAPPATPSPLPLPAATSAPGTTGGAWYALAAALDPSAWRPRLADGVEIVDFPSRRGRGHAVVTSADGATHVRIEPWQAALARHMDGARTVQDLIVERLEATGTLDTSAVTGLVTLLRSQDLLATPAVNVRDIVRRALDPRPTPRARVAEFGRTLRIEWPGVERLTRFLYRTVLRTAFRPTAIVACGLVSAAGFAAFAFLTETGRFRLGEPSYLEIVGLLALAFLRTAFHELGHATAIVHYGRRVISSGVELLFATPAFFVDATDALALPKRQRIAQAFAGPWAEFVMAGSASLLVFAFPEATASQTVYRFALSNYFFIFQNFIPLLRLDGYWMLCDAIDEADLRGSAFGFVRHELWARLRRQQRIRPQEWLLVAFAILGPIYAVVAFLLAVRAWDLGLVVRDLWEGTVASRVLLALLVLVFAGPVLRAGLDLLQAMWRRGRALLARIRFRFQRSWRDEATALIGALPGFDALAPQVVGDLAREVRLGAYGAGQTVFRQGDRPASFYVVRNGEVVVEDVDPATGDTLILRRLGRGSSFGELGLIDMAPRSATVRAAVETQLFEVGKGAFDRLLADRVQAPSFAPSMQSFAEVRALPVFQGLPTDRIREVLAHGEWRSVTAGTPIVTQGQPGDAFYVIGRGQATVTIDGGFVRTLGQGAFFGELALLNDTPRTATVTAASAMRVFRLDREGFDAVVAERFDRARPDVGYRRPYPESEG